MYEKTQKNDHEKTQITTKNTKLIGTKKLKKKKSAQKRLAQNMKTINTKSSIKQKT